MNIPEDIYHAAKARGIDWICTGGGCDYIYRQIDAGNSRKLDLLLTSVEDGGYCPDKLDEPATVSIFFCDNIEEDDAGEWHNSITIDFPTVTAALDFMALDIGVFENDKESWWVNSAREPHPCT